MEGHRHVCRERVVGLFPRGHWRFAARDVHRAIRKEEPMARVALVTGGNRGIGASVSKALLAAGYSVAANYAGNDDVAQRFKFETGISVYRWSVADYDACAEGVKKVEAEIGPV